MDNTSTTEFDANNIWFGRIKTKPKGKVIVSEYEIIMVIERGGNHQENVLINIQWADILKCIYACGERTMMLFRIRSTGSEYIRTKFHLDPIGRGEYL